MNSLPNKPTGLRDDLANKEQALRDLKNKTGLSATHDQRHQIIERIGRLEDDLLASDTARTVSEAKVTSLRNKLSELPDTQITQETSGYGNEGTDRMRDQLYALHVKEAKRRSKYTAGTSQAPTDPRTNRPGQRNGSIRKNGREPRSRRNPAACTNKPKLELLAEEPVLASLNART